MNKLQEIAKIETDLEEMRKEILEEIDELLGDTCCFEMSQLQQELLHYKKEIERIHASHKIIKIAFKHKIGEK